MVHLGRSHNLMPNNPAQVQLHCFYYPKFLIKELDDPGLKGAVWVTISPIREVIAPACRQSHDADERFLDRGTWLFMGVKGSFLFMEPPDGENGAMYFRIIDPTTRRKIFEDTVVVWEAGREIDPFRFAGTGDGRMAIEYRRSVQSTCSIPKDGLSCWNKIRAQLGIQTSAVPKCTGYVEPGKKKWVIGDDGLPPDELDSPSVIAYPVTVQLLLRPIRKVVAGPVSCTAPD